MPLSLTADPSMNHNHLFSDSKLKFKVKMDSFNLFEVSKETCFFLWSAVVLDQMSVFGLAECTLGSDHRPSDKTHYCGQYSVLFFELLASQFTYDYLWILVCTFGSDYRPSLGQTRQDTLLWQLLCTFPYLWGTMLCFLLLLSSTEYFSLFPFSAETSAY